MEQSKKKPIMIGIIVVCIVLAVAITVMRRPGKSGIDSVSDKDMTLVKCNNPDCGAEYQIPTKEYYIETAKNLDPNAPARRVALTCQKCGKTSVYAAKRCEKCGKVFFPGIASRQYPDKCTECGYSKLEEQRSKATKK